MKGKVFYLLALVFCFAIASVAFSQYDYKLPSGKPNPQLKEKLKKGKVGSLFFRNGNDGTYEEWASSTRRAEGKPPKVRREAIEDPSIDDGESLFAYVGWLCMYSAYSAMDGNPKTAWVEGVAGDGIGEVVIVKVNTRRPVRIWAGYGKSETTFKNNNRPKKVRVYVLEGRHDWGGSTELADLFTDIRVVGKHEVILKDLNGYQPLNLPKHTISNKKAITFVAVEILSVYSGTKYKDTCISEIRN